MIGKHLLITAAITTALLISVGAYAGGGMGGGMGGGQGMMGGQGHGTMGNGGNDMMGSGQNFSSPRTSPSDQYKMQEKENLREEIRERRQELSDLYRSDKPDKALIDKKIAELNKLETDYERSVSEAN